MSDARIPVISTHADWPVRAIGEVTTLLRRGTAPVYVDDSDVMAIGQRCVTDTEFDGTRSRPTSTAAMSKVIAPQVGDVLINSTGTGTIGRSVIFRDETTKYIVDGHVTVARPRSADLVSRWLNDVIRSADGQRYLESRCYAGSTNQVELSSAALAAMPIALPSVAEQEQIAEVLDALEGQIRVTREIIAKIQCVRFATLELILSKANESESTRKLVSATSKIVDGVHHTPSYVRSGVPFITVENLTRGPGISLTPCRYISLRAHAIYRKRIEPLPGDVLVSKDGTLGVARLVPDDFPEASIFVSVAVLRPIAAILRPGFLRLFFDTENFRRQLRVLSAGSGLQHIHLEHFREFSIPDLLISIQESIISSISKFDDILKAERAVLEKLVLRRDGIISALLAGRVRMPVEVVVS
jgi:type I restriction enzyme S subunit